MVSAGLKVSHMMVYFEPSTDLNVSHVGCG